jgi:DNA-binding response OmpR family regulator
MASLMQTVLRGLGPSRGMGRAGQRPSPLQGDNTVPVHAEGRDSPFDRPASRHHRGPRRPARGATPRDLKEVDAMSQTCRILIVEDEPNVRLVFRTALESDDHRISLAEDGEKALRWLEDAPVDLVLLDLQMPGVGGMEVLRRLRAAGHDVPVVVITAHDSVPNAVEAMKLGAIDFLAKPLTPEELRRVVAEVLARHPRDESARDPAPDPVPRTSKTQSRDMLTSAKRALNHRLFFRAEGLLREAIKEHPDSAEPWYLLGVLHEVQNKPRAAKEDYRSALRIDPGYEPAKFHLMKFR